MSTQAYTLVNVSKNRISIGVAPAMNPGTSTVVTTLSDAIVQAFNQGLITCSPNPTTDVTAGIRAAIATSSLNPADEVLVQQNSGGNSAVIYVTLANVIASMPLPIVVGMRADLIKATEAASLGSFGVTPSKVIFKASGVTMSDSFTATLSKVNATSKVVIATAALSSGTQIVTVLAASFTNALASIAVGDTFELSIPAVSSTAGLDLQATILP